MAQLLKYYKRSFQQQLRPPAANLQPTFEDLSIDDKLSELQRLIRYSRSAIGLQRLVHVKMLAHIAANVGYWDTNVHIFPLLDNISNDQEPAVRQHLMEQLTLLAQFCCEKGGEDGYTAMVSLILPIIAVALEDDKPEVRHAACATLVHIAKLMQPEDLGQHVLTIVLQLAHEDDKEDRRMTAAELLNSLAESLGIDLCKQFVIPEVVSLAEDPVFRVRKSTALNFHNICKVGGEFELFERLMPAFVRLSKDDMFRVRRACADSLAEIAKYVTDDIRVGVLSEIYLRLAQDQSKLVKQSALQQSGMFIASLPSKAVSEGILDNFCSMAMSPTGDASVDAELRRYCAFSFPAVLQTIGVGRWPEVRELYRALVQSRSSNVKQTLACSLHEIARILSTNDKPQENGFAPYNNPHNNNPHNNGSHNNGSHNGAHNNRYEEQRGGNGYFAGGVSLVDVELIPIFESMLQDEESVQMGVMRHLADFLRMLSVPCRVSYLPLLHDILHSTNLFNWRLRQCLAVQLPALLLLPPPELVFNTLFTLVMTLLQDPVASVRNDSFLGVAKMIMILSIQADNLAIALSKIEDDSNSSISTTNTNSIDTQNLDSQSTGHHSESRGQRNKIHRQLHHSVAITAAHHVDIVANAIQTLIQGKTYRLRQLWVELSHSLLIELPRALFEKHFLDGLLYLASDPVSNVRVAVAAVLAGWESYRPPASAIELTHIVNTRNAHSTHTGTTLNGNIAAVSNGSNGDVLKSDQSEEKNGDWNDNVDNIEESPVQLHPLSPWNWLLRRLDVAQCIIRLSVDDKDVYLAIVKLQPIFPHIIFRIVSCRGLKEAPGGRNPVPNMYTGAFSQPVTCVASPSTIVSGSCSSGDSQSECGDDGEVLYAVSSEDDGSPTWEPCNSFTMSALSEDDRKVRPTVSMVDRQIRRPSERVQRSSTPTPDGVYPLSDRDSPIPRTRDSPLPRDPPVYRGSPVPFLGVGDDIRLGSSPARDVGFGFGVRSPHRRIEASAVLLQQQQEERESERLLHLGTKGCLPVAIEEGVMGLPDSPEEESSHFSNIDLPMGVSMVPMGAEEELQLSPSGGRRIAQMSAFDTTRDDRDDSDDDDVIDVSSSTLPIYNQNNLNCQSGQINQNNQVNLIGQINMMNQSDAHGNTMITTVFQDTGYISELNGITGIKNDSPDKYAEHYEDNYTSINNTHSSSSSIENRLSLNSSNSDPTVGLICKLSGAIISTPDTYLLLASLDSITDTAQSTVQLTAQDTVNIDTTIEIDPIGPQ